MTLDDRPTSARPSGFRLQAEDHTARCYLYSPAVDPAVLPEVKR